MRGLHALPPSALVWVSAILRDRTPARDQQPGCVALWGRWQHGRAAVSNLARPWSRFRLGLGVVGVLISCQLVGCANQAPAPDAAVSGVALTRERMRLPPDTVFEATLLDVTHPDAPPVVLGRERREWAGSPPYAMRIPYASARFEPKGRYEVRVTVTQEGRLLLATDQRYPVPQEAAFRNINVWLERPQLPQAAAASADAAVPLTLTHWQLVDIDDVPVPRPPQGAVAPYVVFEANEKRITGSGGCNRFLADYAVSGSRLQVSQLVSNITLCLQSGGTEARFFEAMGAVVGFRQQGSVLMLKGTEGQTLLRFEAQETPVR